ncbi:hypothetical protein [Roseovarius sp. Pro17]|uniref:hypothetical protein n=1 Tax=Roseovarius sp. Pro17 TaxID=3108175 RepID=UPI002D78CB49|nr:hypothetical protein [Roseovarius sp. Pro17]
MLDGKKLRQAVVVIHGIGEQKPMTTLRKFTAAAVSPDNPEPRFTSHPDKYSNSLELFTLRAPPRSAGNEIPIADFFECHWAHRMRDTKFRHVGYWFWRLLFTPPQKNSRVYAIYWIVLIIIFGLGAGVLYAAIVTPWDKWLKLTGLLSSGVVTTLLGGFLWTYVNGYVGDAARYLTPHPDNLTERAAIRRQAISLLHRLHRQGRYQRIIVVGHSLGSVIAYDVVSRLWDQYRQNQRENLTEVEQAILEEIEILGAKLRLAGEALDEAKSKRGGAPKSEKEVVNLRLLAVESAASEYRKSQIQLWEEQKRAGNPWLITDLVTLGSPLAHADFLLRAAGDRGRGLKEGLLDREYPRCPPLNDNWDRKKEQHYPAKVEDAIAYRPIGQQSRVLIPSALFALVRWTNLYFPGDLVGGPLAPEFGYGILDFEARRHGTGDLKDRLASWSPLCHTKYWAVLGRDSEVPGTATQLLRQTLALETKETQKLLDRVSDIQRTRSAET